VEVDLRRYSRIADSVAQFRFRIRFFALIEFVDSDGTPGLSSADLMCGRYFIRGPNFSIGQITTTTVNGTAVSEFDVTSSNGPFALKFYVSGTASDTRGRTFMRSNRPVIPTSVKFDILINNYWAGTFNNGSAACANSKLELLAKAKSAQLTKHKDDQSGAATVSRAVQFGDAATPLGFFTWADTVSISGGGSASVIVAPLVVESLDTSFDGMNEESGNTDSGEAVRRAIYSFDTTAHPALIEWDPELGYSDSMNGVGRLTSSVVAVCAAVLFAIASPLHL